jgi:hypothetical protein
MIPKASAASMKTFNSFFSSSQSTSIPQASSIWLADAMIPKASVASKKTLKYLFAILQWGACFMCFFGVVDARASPVSLEFWVILAQSFG